MTGTGNLSGQQATTQRARLTQIAALSYILLLELVNPAALLLEYSSLAYSNRLHQHAVTREEERVRAISDRWTQQTFQCVHLL
jgi:hypothetical protein